MQDENPRPEAPRELDIRQIMSILPHRYPFLLIDRILESSRKKRIVAIKNVTINEPFFQGHFPDYAIMPGVLMVEAIAQAGGVLLLPEVPDHENKLLVFSGIDRARFRRPVVPGDQLAVLAQLDTRTDGAIGTHVTGLWNGSRSSHNGCWVNAHS